MATDNVVRVLFEGYTDKLKQSVGNVIDTVNNLGEKGKETSKNLEMKEAHKATTNLSKAIQETGEVATATGKKGKDASNEIRDGVEKLNTQVENFNKTLNNAVKIFATGWVLGKVKGLLSSVTSYTKAGGEMANALALNQQKLTHIMHNTMQATEEEIEGILRLTEVQENLGVVSRTAQIAGSQELSTYLTKSETLKKLIPIMNDMIAQQYGVNASSESAVGIATMLGKVMDGQTGALSRYGYAFDEVQEYILNFGTEAEKAAVLAEVVGSSIGGMNEALASTNSGQIGSIATILDNTKIKVGEMSNEFKANIAGQILPHMNTLSDTVIEVFDRIFSKLNNTFSDTSFIDSFINSIIVSIETLGDIASQIFAYLPQGINITTGALNLLSSNLSNVVGVADIAVKTFLLLKSALSITEVVKGVNEALTLYKSITQMSTVATKLFSLAMNSIPLIGIIGLITALIAWIIHLWQTNDKFKVAVLEGIAQICDALSWLTQLLPSVSSAFENMAISARNSIDKVNNKIDETRANLNALSAETHAVDMEINAKNVNFDPTESISTVDYEKYRKEMENASAKKSSAGTKSSPRSTSTIKDNRTAFEKELDSLNESYDSKKSVVDSRISLAEAQKDKKAVKSFKESMVELLEERLKKVAGLENLTTNEKEENILEVTRNKLMTEILNLMGSINENTAELIGEFNKPAGLDIMNKYQYEIENSENHTIGKYFSNSTVNMYLQYKEMNESSGKDVRANLEGFADGFFEEDDKNKIVNDGLLDVLRN